MWENTKEFKENGSQRAPKCTISPPSYMKRTPQFSGIFKSLLFLVENITKTSNGRYRRGVVVWGGGRVARRLDCFRQVRADRGRSPEQALLVLYCFRNILRNSLILMHYSSKVHSISALFSSSKVPYISALFFKCPLYPPGNFFYSGVKVCSGRHRATQQNLGNANFFPGLISPPAPGKM